MSAVDWSRLQFATTTIYHFLFVPLTIGLAFLTAILQTLWYRKGHPEHLRLTRFFGTLLVINVAIGVVTGLVQEFQFGMNWSAYSRFVGDVFGAPLAMEGLAAFFLESVFLGLWLFGWDRLSRRVHLATIWAVAVGGVLSAAFIMAANSWMQRPVGYQLNAAGDRAQLTDIWAVLTNIVFLWAYLHVLAASLVTASVVMLAVSAWHLRRRSGTGHVRAVGQGRHRGPGPGDHAGAVLRRPARHQRDEVPADEDRRRRGPVGDLPAVLVLGVPDRRGQQRPQPDQDHPDPAPAVGAGHRHLERPGGRPQRGPGAVPAAVRRRQLPPQRLHPVLVDAGHGLLGRRDAPVRAVGGMAGLAQAAGRRQVVPARGHLGAAGAVRDEHRRLAADRERPPALDRARAPEGHRRRLALGQRGHGGHQPQRVRPPLRRPWRGRRAADGPRGPPRARCRPPRTRRRKPPCSTSPTEAGPCP